jgi:hypothetical protein
MFAANPKKEFTLSYSIEQVKEAIHKSINSDPGYWKLVSDDAVLNQIRIHQKGVLMDMGYHIDFDLTKLSDTETKVVIEVSRNVGAINTASEVTIAGNSLKTIASTLSAFLSGNVDEKGKAKIQQNTGCLLFIVAGSAISMLYYFL